MILSSNEPYWISVLKYYFKKGYVSNGLTIPFLIGVAKKTQPEKPYSTISEFLNELVSSAYSVTLMTCPTLGQIVIGLMDSDSKVYAERGYYKKFGSLYITDDTFDEVTSIDEIIQYCVVHYNQAISQEKFSFDHGSWQNYSTVDLDRFKELVETTLNMG